ncbi:MAG: DUF3144 domain-containing protein [Comamonadaceae bacterium]|nr:MAG: DUF3144 domain-containing protein [Comamonadaceae bacterium]
MPKPTDPAFYDRADAHIHLSNRQAPEVGTGPASASMLYGTARFNAWVSALDFRSGAEMAARREDILAYFTEQYRRMLEDNLDDYIANFERHMAPRH